MTSARPGRLGRETWYIAGCGCMGSLAAHHLLAAGCDVVIVRDQALPCRRLHLTTPTGRHIRNEAVPVRPASACPTIRRLLVATKTPFTHRAMAALSLADDAILIRLQNGIGSLDGLTRPGQRVIEAVTASAVKTGPGDTHIVVAENATAFGGGPAPAWWPDIAGVWPQAHWHDDIRHAQWQKLVVNSVLNPLTACADVPNGRVFECPELAAEADALAGEADALLARLDPTWPGYSAARVAEIARATAANTSSMRADIQAGSVTEIEAINGWLLARAAERGMALPHHAAITARIRARHPGHA